MNKKSKIVILVTGGTFDKEYNEITGKLFFNDSHIREMLDLGRCKLQVNIKKLTFWTDIAQHTDQMNNDEKTLLSDFAKSIYERRLSAPAIFLALNPFDLSAITAPNPSENATLLFIIDVTLLLFSIYQYLSNRI